MIDALCIIQDFVGDEDWLHEAAIMGDVYAKLTCNTRSD